MADTLRNERNLSTKKQEQDKQIKLLIGELINIIGRTSTRSDEVKKFIVKNRNVGDFVELAKTVILLKEGVSK